MAAFGLAKLIGSPVFGWLVDRSASSRQSFLMVGLLLQAAGTLMLGLGTHVAVFVASRLLQGFSAAVIYTGGFALLVDSVPAAEIGKWMGVVMAGEIFGVLVSPILGGVLYGEVGWGAVFGVMIAVVGVDVLLRLAMIEKGTAARWMIVENEIGKPPGSDDPKAISSPLVEEVDPAPSPSESQPLLLPSGNPNDCRIKEATETASKLPTILIFLGQPRILVAFFSIFIAHTHVTALDSVIPRFVHLRLDFSPTHVGLLYIVWAVPSLATSLGGHLSDKHGPRWIAALGLLLATVALALFPLVTHRTLGQIALVCVVLVMDGLAFSLLYPPLASDMAAVVEKLARERPELSSPKGDYGQVFSLLSCGIAAGTTIGPLVGGWLFEGVGWGPMCWTFAGFLALAGGLVVGCFLLEHVVLLSWARSI